MEATRRGDGEFQSAQGLTARRRMVSGGFDATGAMQAELGGERMARRGSSAAWRDVSETSDELTQCSVLRRNKPRFKHHFLPNFECNFKFSR